MINIISYIFLVLLFFVLITSLFLILFKKRENWGWGPRWRRGWGPTWRRGWDPTWRSGWDPTWRRGWDLDKRCLNSCCDPISCSKGLGCIWTDLKGDSISGSTDECIRFKKCLSENLNDKHANEKCLNQIY